jgi:alpha-tubulin suppressor-like RCC1 family protein
LIENFTLVEESTAGTKFSLLINNSIPHSFGINNFGQLCLGDFAQRTIPTSITVPGFAIKVSAGYYHSLILLNNGDGL